MTTGYIVQQMLLDDAQTEPQAEAQKTDASKKRPRQQQEDGQGQHEAPSAVEAADKVTMKVAGEPTS